MDKLEFSKGMKILEEHLLIKGEKLTDANIEIYWSRLKDYNNNIFKKAIMECIDTLKYFPKVAEIKELIEGKPEDEAELAYLGFRKKLDNEGSYLSVSFPKYPAVGEVIEALGGWIKVSDTLENDEKWLKIEFKKLYPIMKRRGDYPDRLIGRFEIENSNKGYNERTMEERYGRLLDGSKIERRRLEKK